MNFYKHYIGDFQRDTGHLSLTERGAYLALMHYYYATEKPLPNDLTALCRIAGAVTKQEQAAVKAVLSFFEVVESGLMHTRIEAELQKAGEISNTNREIAIQREAKRKAEREGRTEHDSCSKRETIRSTTTSTNGALPDSRLQTPDLNPTDTSSPDLPTVRTQSRANTRTEPEKFDEIRDAYPARGGGQRWQDAVKHYRARIREGHTHEAILAGVQRYAEYIRETDKTGSEFVQQAASFLGTNRGFLEPWAIPRAPPDKPILSAVDRVRLANSGAKNDERVVSEQRQSGDGLDVLGGDVRFPVGESLRRVGS